MKTLYRLLFLVPLALLFSCTDSDDLPSVNVSMTFSNASYYDNTLYVVEGTDMSIDALSVKSTDGARAVLANVEYYWDGYFQPGITFGIYPNVLSTSTQNLGRHSLDVECNILEVDKTIAVANFRYPVVIVQNEQSLPENAPVPGTYTVTTLVSPRD